MGILEVWSHFLKKYLIWDHETWFTGTNMAPLGPIFGPFLTPNISWEVSTELARNLIYTLTGGTFAGV